MNYLLFGGASNVGKTETITRLVAWLNGKGFVPPLPALHLKPVGSQNDFFARLDGTNLAGKKTRILISTTADKPWVIKDFKTFCDSHKPYDFIISAIRDGGDPERKNFFSIMGIASSASPEPKGTSSDYVLEIPMGKITRKNTRKLAKDWYRNAIDHLAHKLLGYPPFSI